MVAQEGLAVGPPAGLKLGQVVVQQFRLAGVVRHGSFTGDSSGSHHLLQLADRPHPQHLHRRPRTLHPLGHLVERQPLQVPQHDHFLVVGRQLGQARPSSATRRRSARTPGWAWRRGPPARARRRPSCCRPDGERPPRGRPAAWPCPDSAARNRPHCAPGSASARPATPAPSAPGTGRSRDTPPASSPAPGPRHRPSPAASSPPASGRRNRGSCGRARKAAPGIGHRRRGPGGSVRKSRGIRSPMGEGLGIRD